METTRAAHKVEGEITTKIPKLSKKNKNRKKIVFGKFDPHYQMAINITILNLIPIIWVTYDANISEYSRRKLKSAVVQIMSHPIMPIKVQCQVKNMQ